MRIHDLDNDRAIGRAAIYLTIKEVAQMLGFMMDMIKKNGGITDFCINDPEGDHQLEVYLYNDFELVRFNQRQKMLIQEDC